jgi:ribosomal protein S18 acetylase RimI-like enzyme
VTLSYRRPALHEAAAMAELHVQCWREAYSDIVPQEVVDNFDAAKMTVAWDGHLANSERFVIGVFDDGRPVAFINQGKPVEKIFENMDGHIAAIYVAQSHYRQGIGRKLLALAAQAWMTKDGYSLSLGVLAKNIRARSFYENLGARKVMDDVYNWSGQDLPGVIYVFENLSTLIP